MSVSLTEALRDVDLQPGQTYRYEVRGHNVELRVLDKQTATTVNPRSPLRTSCWSRGWNCRSSLAERKVSAASRRLCPPTSRQFLTTGKTHDLMPESIVDLRQLHTVRLDLLVALCLRGQRRGACSRCTGSTSRNTLPTPTAESACRNRMKRRPEHTSEPRSGRKIVHLPGTQRPTRPTRLASRLSPLLLLPRSETYHSPVSERHQDLAMAVDCQAPGDGAGR